jgi:DNA-binding response OmpR family regulator
MDENFAQTSGVDGMRGMAATRAIRAFSLPDLVIIGCTGDSSETHDAMAVEAGQDAVLGKPVSMESVEAVVRAHLTRLPSRLRVVAAGRSADRFVATVPAPAEPTAQA